MMAGVAVGMEGAAVGMSLPPGLHRVQSGLGCCICDHASLRASMCLGSEGSGGAGPTAGVDANGSTDLVQE
jgi:hypothetical protein